MVRHTEFYDLIGVAPTATQEEIRRAYRRRALQLHPDRGGDEEAFKRLTHVHEILSDPARRNLYDRFGPNVATASERGGDVGLAEMREVLASMPGLGIFLRCLCMLLVVLVVWAVVWLPLFISLRVDNAVGWGYGVVFLPLWIFFGVVCCCFCCAEMARRSKPMGAEGEGAGDEEDQRIPPELLAERERFLRLVELRMCLILVPLFLFALFLCLRLDGSISWPWIVVFIPWMAYAVLSILVNAVSWEVQRASFRERWAMEGLPPLPAWAELPWLAHRAFTFHVASLLTAVALGVALADGRAESLALAFIPLWLYGALRAAEAGVKLYLAQRAQRGSRSGGDAMLEFAVRLVLLLAAATILVLVLASAGTAGGLSGFVIFSPLFALCGLLLCGCCVYLFCCLRLPTENEGTDEEAQRMHDPAAAERVVPAAAELPEHLKGVTDVQQLKDEATRFLNAGEISKALGVLNRAVDLEPQNSVLLSNRSVCHLRNGDAHAAERDARRCVEVAPTWPRGFGRLGAALFELGDFEASARAYEQGLALEPDNETFIQGKRLALQKAAAGAPKQAAVQQAAAAGAGQAAAAAASSADEAGEKPVEQAPPVVSESIADID